LERREHFTKNTSSKEFQSFFGGKKVATTSQKEKKLKDNHLLAGSSIYRLLPQRHAYFIDMLQEK
jgi:hypothetical protein